MICKKGCKGRIIGPDQYCDCIERKLPKLANYVSVKARNMDPVVIDQYCMSQHSLKDLYTSAVSREDTEKALKAYGLTTSEVELFIDHYFDNLSFNDIAKAKGWTSRQTVSQHHQKLLKKLRKAGFTI